MLLSSTMHAVAHGTTASTAASTALAVPRPGRMHAPKDHDAGRLVVDSVVNARRRAGSSFSAAVGITAVSPPAYSRSSSPLQDTTHEENTYPSSIPHTEHTGRAPVHSAAPFVGAAGTAKPNATQPEANGGTVAGISSSGQRMVDLINRITSMMHTPGLVSEDAGDTAGVGDRDSSPASASTLPKQVATPAAAVHSPGPLPAMSPSVESMSTLSAQLSAVTAATVAAASVIAMQMQQQQHHAHQPLALLSSLLASLVPQAMSGGPDADKPVDGARHLLGMQNLKQTIMDASRVQEQVSSTSAKTVCVDAATQTESPEARTVSPAAATPERCPACKNSSRVMPAMESAAPWQATLTAFSDTGPVAETRAQPVVPVQLTPRAKNQSPKPQPRMSVVVESGLGSGGAVPSNSACDAVWESPPSSPVQHRASSPIEMLPPPPPLLSQPTVAVSTPSPTVPLLHRVGSDHAPAESVLHVARSHVTPHETRPTPHATPRPTLPSLLGSTTGRLTADAIIAATNASPGVWASPRPLLMATTPPHEHTFPAPWPANVAAAVGMSSTRLRSSSVDSWAASSARAEYARRWAVDRASSHAASTSSGPQARRALSAASVSPRPTITSPLPPALGTMPLHFESRTPRAPVVVVRSAALSMLQPAPLVAPTWTPARGSGPNAPQAGNASNMTAAASNTQPATLPLELQRRAQLAHSHVVVHVPYASSIAFPRNSGAPPSPAASPPAPYTWTMNTSGEIRAPLYTAPTQSAGEAREWPRTHALALSASPTTGASSHRSLSAPARRAAGAAWPPRL